MEILIAIAIIVAFVAVWFSRKPKALVEAEQAPYKVETPVVEIDQAAVVAASEASALETVKKTRKPRAPKAEKAPAKKPATKKTTGRKPKAK